MTERRWARWRILGVGGLLVAIHGSAAGITAVTRRTAMAGVPAGAAAPAAGNPGNTVSPQPQAAAGLLLPGATPPGSVPGRPALAAAPPTVRPGPGEALLAPPSPAPAHATVRTNAGPARVQLNGLGNQRTPPRTARTNTLTRTQGASPGNAR